MKKILVGLGVISTALIPVVTVVSCGKGEAAGHSVTYHNEQYNAEVLVTYDKDRNVSSVVVTSERTLSDAEVKNLLYSVINGNDISTDDKSSLTNYCKNFGINPIQVSQIIKQPTIISTAGQTGNNPQDNGQTNTGSTQGTSNPQTNTGSTQGTSNSQTNTGTSNTQTNTGSTQGTSNPQTNTGTSNTQTNTGSTQGTSNPPTNTQTTPNIDPQIAINAEQTRVNGLSFAVASETQQNFAGISTKTILTPSLASQLGLNALISNNAFTYYITNAHAFNTADTSTTVTILVSQGGIESAVTPAARPVSLTPKSIPQTPGPVVNTDRDDANREQTRVNGLSFTAGSETASDFAGITSKTWVNNAYADMFGLHTLIANTDYDYFITEAPAFTTASTSTTIKILVEKNGEAATVPPAFRTVTLTPKTGTPVAVVNNQPQSISVEDEIAEMTKVKAVFDRSDWSNFTPSLFNSITNGSTIDAKVYETEYINFAFDKSLNISDTVAREIISKFYEYTNWGFGLMSMDTILITNKDFGSAGRGGAAKDIILHIQDNSEDQLQILFDVMQHEYGHHETMKSSGLVGGSQARMRNLISNNAPASNIISVTAPSTLTWQDNYIPNKDTDPNVLALKDQIWNNLYDNYQSEPRVGTQVDSQGRITGGTIDPSQLGNILAGLSSGYGLTTPQVQPLTHQNQADYKVRLSNIYTAPIFANSLASVDKYVTRNDPYYMDLAYQFNQYEYLNNTMNILEFEPLHDVRYRNGSSVLDNDNLAFYLTGTNHSETILDPTTGDYNQANTNKIIDLWSEYVYGYRSNGTDTNQMYMNDIFVGGYGNLPDFDLVHLRVPVASGNGAYRKEYRDLEVNSIPTHFLSGRTSYGTHATWDTSHRAYYVERIDESVGTVDMGTVMPIFFNDTDGDNIYTPGVDQEVAVSVIKSVNH